MRVAGEHLNARSLVRNVPSSTFLFMNHRKQRRVRHLATDGTTDRPSKRPSLSLLTLLGGEAAGGVATAEGHFEFWGAAFQRRHLNRFCFFFVFLFFATWKPRKLWTHSVDL